MSYFDNGCSLGELREKTISGSFEMADMRFRLVVQERFEDPFEDSDVPLWFGEQLFFRKSTCEAVVGELHRWGHVFDVDCDGGEYMMFSPPVELDIYDYEKSEYTMRDDKVMWDIPKPAFKSDLIPESAFVAPLDRRNDLYIPGEMMDLLVSGKVAGALFEKVWEY